MQNIVFKDRIKLEKEKTATEVTQSRRLSLKKMCGLAYACQV